MFSAYYLQLILMNLHFSIWYTRRKINARSHLKWCWCRWWFEKKIISIFIRKMQRTLENNMKQESPLDSVCVWYYILPALLLLLPSLLDIFSCTRYFKWCRCEVCGAACVKLCMPWLLCLLSIQKFLIFFFGSKCKC